VMSSRTATESFCFVHTTQYIYEEEKKERFGAFRPACDVYIPSALER